MKKVCTALAFCFATATSPAQAVSDKWIDQKEKTKDFRFSVKYSFEETETRGAPAPLALRVRDRNSNTVTQEIAIDEAYPTDTPLDERLSIVDINFDGYPDIDLYAMSGGAGPNDTHFFYIYDPTKKTFQFNAKLSSLTQVAIDQKKKTITAAFRDGCCHHSSETYRFIAGRLTLVASWEETLWSKDGHISEFITTTTGKLVNGKMTYSTTRARVKE